MGLIDTATAPLRAVLHSSEDVAAPLRDLEDIQRHVLHAADAIKDSTEQLSNQVAVLDKLVDSLVPLVAETLPALTLAVQQLTVELASVKPLADGVNELRQPLAPLATLPDLTAAVTEIREPLMALPPLTASVTELNQRLGVVAEVLEPLAKAENEMSKVGHVFSRHKPDKPS